MSAIRGGAVFLLVVIASCALAEIAVARPGGGDTFSGGGGGGWSGGGGSSGGGWSGGGGSSGSSSGGGAGEWRAPHDPTQYPVSMGAFVLVISCLAVAIGAVSIAAAKRLSASSLDAGAIDSAATYAGALLKARAIDAAAVQAMFKPPPRADLSVLREHDPDFSHVLFADFLYALYSRAQRARHDGAALRALTPYLSARASDELARRALPGLRVTAAVVGAMWPLRVTATTADWVRVSFETNLVLEGDGGAATEYVVEEWVVHRNRGVLTRPWTGVRSFDCPSCGAPAEKWDDNRCARCGELVEGGRFDWAVQSIDVKKLERRPPSLTGTTQEVGTDRPTVFHPAVQSLWKTLTRDDPQITRGRLGARLQCIYEELTRGWNAQDVAILRPFVSDGVAATMTYWIGAYRSQRLRNVLESARLTNWALVKVVRDKHYDAITVRLHASGLDYTLDADTRVVGGSRTAEREYSEYWTLIRGAAVRGAPRADRNCPSCGAGLEVGMGGECAFCKRVITRGDFDWVLSIIEQDDVYQG